jgi:hypothetical protein
MSNSVTPRWASCVHESSHSVMSLSYGFPVDRLSVSKDGLSGVCSFRHPGATAEQLAAIFLAGVLGERFVARDTNLDTARTDIAEATKLTAGIDLDALVLRVRQRLASLWTEIDRLAEALDKHGSLDSGAVERAIRTPLAWLRS